MCLAFLLEGLAVYGLFSFVQQPFLGAILSGLVFFAWGEIYALSPQRARTSTATLYTAKGAGGPRCATGKSAPSRNRKLEAYLSAAVLDFAAACGRSSS